MAVVVAEEPAEKAAGFAAGLFPAEEEAEEEKEGMGTGSRQAASGAALVPPALPSPSPSSSAWALVLAGGGLTADEAPGERDGPEEEGAGEEAFGARDALVADVRTSRPCFGASLRGPPGEGLS